MLRIYGYYVDTEETNLAIFIPLYLSTHVLQVYMIGIENPYSLPVHGYPTETWIFCKKHGHSMEKSILRVTRVFHRYSIPLYSII